jgi:putative phosphoesterase
MIRGFVSDAHGNAEALRRALSVLRSAGAEQIAFLGDAVGYVPTLEAFDLIEAEGLAAVRGNHEDMLLNGTTPSERDRIYGHAAIRSLMSEQRTRMAAWPARRVLDEGNVLAVHGSPANPIEGYVYPDTPLNQFAPAAPIVVMGHTHRPFVRKANGTLYVNAGSCAMPRDTGGFGSAAIVDTADQVARILRFDIRDAVDDVISRFTLHDEVIRSLRRPVSVEMEGLVVHA